MSTFNVLPFRTIKNKAFTVLVGAGETYAFSNISTAEVSKDGGAFVQTTNLPTNVGRGCVSVALTATEMNADNVFISLANASGADGICGAIVYTMPEELSALPTGTSLLHERLLAVYQYHFNKRAVTATAETLYKTDGSTAIATGTLADNGTTFTKGALA